MQFGQLLRRRLTIANSAAQNDPTVSDSIKGVLSVMGECLAQQAASMQLIQAELSDKIGSSEFKQVTGQKLSLREFLAYFQKVERIVQKMQNHWTNTQTRTQQLLQSKLEVAMEEINMTMSMRTDQTKKEFYQKIGHIQNRTKNMEQFAEMAAVLKDQVKSINANCNNRWEDTKRKLTDRLAQTKQELMRSCSSSEKLSAVVGEIKHMQTYFNQTHEELASLIKSFALAEGARTQSVAPQLISHMTALENVIRWFTKRIARQMVLVVSCRYWSHALVANGRRQLGRTEIFDPLNHRNIDIKSRTSSPCRRLCIVKPTLR